MQFPTLHPRNFPAAHPRGGVLLTVVILIFAVSIVVGSIVSQAVTGLRLAHRNDIRAQMTTVADSELEWLFYSVKMATMSGTPASDLASSSWINALADFSETPTTTRDVYLDEHRATGWRVQRSVRHLLSTNGVDTSNGGSRRALLDYIEAKIVILPPDSGPYSQFPAVRIGRYFVASQSTIFQYGVFFDGDLELNPGENYTLDGDIYTSGDAYLAPVSGKQLFINQNAKLRIIDGNTLNGSSSASAIGSVRYNPDAPLAPVSFGDPLFGLTGTGAPGAQLENLTAEENLLGGLDALATAIARPDLFGPSGRTDPTTWTSAEKKIAEQNVKRSLIVPPPSAASTYEYPNSPSTDDSSISVQRAYTRAQIIVNVSSSGGVSIQTRNSDGSLSNTTSAYNGLLLTAPLVPAVVTTVSGGMYDAREGTTVAITELNVAALKSRLELSGVDFNGLVYVNLQNASSTSPAAVRVVNGENVPVTAGGTGLSIATNGGLYVQGSYNTTPAGTAENGTPIYPSSMLMADAITVLSYAWDDSDANGNVETDRVASVDNPLSILNVEDAISINAGLITGNSISNNTNSSGGAQNLIRFLENWSGKQVNMLGSLGRVFDSRVMDGAFLGTSTVYRAPNRSVTYDANLAKQPPAGSPIITGFSRGDLFRF